MRVYQEQHYEDVARILMGTWPEAVAITGREVHATGILGSLGRDFANLFAADNPSYCSHCGQHEEEADSTACHSPNEEHNLEGGFDRERFLRACGLAPLPA